MNCFLLSLLSFTIAPILSVPVGKNSSLPEINWTGTAYPDPRTDHDSCNIAQPGNLCDPDQVLTDEWRKVVLEKINNQMERLEQVKILFKDNATKCTSKKGVEIFIALSKQIDTIAMNKTSDIDLIRFGKLLAIKYGLSTAQCQNYVILIGVERPKLAYFKTGSDLKLPQDVTNRVFNQYSPLFDNKNYLDGLSKIIDDIGELMEDPFKPTTTTTTTTTTVPVTTTIKTTSTSTFTSTTVTTHFSTELKSPTKQPNTLSTVTLPEQIESTADKNGKEIAQLNVPESQNTDAKTKDNTIFAVIPWWLMIVLLCVILACALAIVVCLTVRHSKRYKSRPVTVALNTRSKKIHPTSANASSIGSQNTRSGNNYSSSFFNARDEIDPDATSIRTISDNGECDVRPTTPTKIASRVQIDSAQLATDQVARTTVLAKESVMEPEPPKPTVAPKPKIGPSAAKDRREQVRRLKSNGDEFIF